MRANMPMFLKLEWLFAFLGIVIVVAALVQ